MTRTPDNFDRFERRVVFRTARGYFIAIALIALFVFGGGVIVGMRGAARTTPPAPVAPAELPDVPVPGPLTLDDIKAWQNRPVLPMQESGSSRPTFLDAPQAPKGEPEKSPVAIEIDRVKALFPEPQYVWKSEYENRCVTQSSYGCLRRDRVLVREGIDSILGKILTDDELRDPDQLLPILQAITSALTPVAVEERGQWLADTVEAQRARQIEWLGAKIERDRLQREAEDAFGMRRAEFELEAERIESERADDFSHALYGISIGLALLACVGVFLAHLAMERHLRELRELLADTRHPRPPFVGSTSGEAT